LAVDLADENKVFPELIRVRFAEPVSRNVDGARGGTFAAIFVRCFGRGRTKPVTKSLDLGQVGTRRRRSLCKW